MRSSARGGAVTLAALMALAPGSVAFAHPEGARAVAGGLEVEAEHPYVMLGDEAEIEASYELELEGDMSDDDDDSDDNENTVSVLPTTIVFTVDFGDGSPVETMSIDEIDVDDDEFEAEAVAPHIYAAEGEYTVSVTATPDVGEADTAAAIVRITTDAVPYPLDGDDACPEDSIPDSGFDDVDGSSVHEPSVDCLTAWGLIAGDGKGGFAPSNTLNREQLATLLVRVIERAGGTLPAGGDVFADDDGSVHEDNIDKLANAGLVNGVGGDEYAPGAAVTRAQMSTLLVRVYDYLSESEVAAVLDYFTDDDGDAHEDNINGAAAAGFTSGRSLGSFSPGGKVTREQIATFLMRALDRLVTQDGVTF